MTVHILGGGPTGMAIVHGLTLADRSDFVLIERGETLGGLAQSITWDGCGTHDLGPHKLFTLDDELMTRVENLLPHEEWLTRDKISRIYIKGHFLPYPPSPFSLAKVFGVGAFVGMTASYGIAKARGLFTADDARTFEDDLRARLGGPLYEVLFKPIAEKLWGDPLDLDVKLSRSRVQTPAALEIIARLLKLRKTSDFEALTFRYPRGGLQKLWDSIRSQAGAQSRFLLGHEVTAIETEARRVRTIRCLDRTSGETRSLNLGRDDFVASTVPISRLPTLLSAAISDRCRRQIQEMIVLNDLLLVFLKIDRPQLFPESWIFVPDPDIPFHRVSEQESFDPGMTGSGSIVCCEIMSHALRPLARQSDQEIIDAAKQGIAQMGYQGFEVEAERLIRLPKTYPVFRPGFEPALAEVLAELDQLENLRTLGRQGGFAYIGSLDAMDIGYGFARWYVDREAASWKAERDRTSHYPVLD